MHLHQLKIKNLASLRGEHTIDFDLLAGQDLFAITGETGAGKSTLLNAVALALYGKVYKRQLNQSDLVTLGERDASIDLVFSVRGVKHLAKWSTTVRKKNGELLSTARTDRFFYLLPDDGEPRVLDKNPEEILSMDFDQFSKCVILNQGEFARFLTATFAERRDILERLYPSDNLEMVGGLAKKKFEVMQEKLQRLDVQVHSLSEETLFDVEAAKLSEKKWQESYESAQRRLKELRPWAQGLDELKSYATKHSEAKIKLTAASEQLSFRTQENNSAMTQASSHQELLEKFEADLEKTRPTLEAHDQEARTLEALAAQLKEKKKTLEDKSRSAQLIKERHHALLTEKSQLEKNITLLTAKLKWPHALAWDKVDFKEWDKCEREWPLYEQEATQLATQLNDLTQTGKQLALHEGELKEQITKLTQALAPELQILNQTERLTQLRSWRETQVREAQSASERTKITSELQTLTVEREQAKETLQKLALLAENEALRFALHQAKSLLLKSHDPQNCPLCEQSVSQSQWNQLKASWPHPLASDAQAKYEVAKRLDEKRETQITLLKQRLEALPQTKTLSVDLAQQEQLHEKINQLSMELVSLEKRLNETRQHWKTISDKESVLKKKIQDLTQIRDRLLHETSTHVGATLLWAPGLLGELKIDFEVVREKNEATRAHEKLTQQLSSLESDQKKLTQEISDLEAFIQTQDADYLTRHKILAQLYPGSTPQAMLKAKTDEWRALTSKQQLLNNEHRQKEQALSEARANLGRIQEQLQQLELLFAELSARMNQTRPVNVTILEAQQVLTPLFDEVSLEIKREETLAQEANTESSKLKTLLIEDQKRREKKALFEAQQGEARKEADRWKRLLDVLGADDMRTYVLSLVEAALIQQTNFELQKLCSGRYEIQHNAKKGKLVPEFWIIDRWRDGLLRKVTTLSGGETFMVSLAMALALAEMARGRADIDSFFIDEGFGTLDEDSLEDVMDMLQQVRSRGKQIGLITHVKSLSSRLPINLRVAKDQRGNSTVSVVWN